MIPVDSIGWHNALDDSGIVKLPNQLSILVAEVEGAVGDGRFIAARMAADSIRSWLEPALGNVWCLKAFAPAEHGGVARLHASLSRAGSHLLDRLEGELIASSVSVLEEVNHSIASILSINVVESDPWRTAFGVDRESIIDARGAFNSSRLLGVFHRRYPRLKELLAGLLSPITVAEVPLVAAIEHVNSVMSSPRPLIALRTAIGVRELILRRFVEDEEATAMPLRDLWTRADRSYSSGHLMKLMIMTLTASETRGDRAVLRLDVYRRMIEGQLRPWAWALISLLNGAGGRMPEIAQIRERLLASNNPLAADAAMRILPAARNAAAHEDYMWDPGTKSLRVGDEFVSDFALDAETDAAYAFICGAELGWTAAATENPILDSLFRPHPDVTRSPAVNRSGASAYFGTNGLLLTRWEIDDETLSIGLEGLALEQVNPCIQATMWAALHLPSVDHFVLLVSGGKEPVMTLHRSALEGIWPLWLPARRWFESMPAAIFIPALMSARTVVEAASTVAEAAAWLTLNDAVHAFADLLEGIEVPVDIRLRKLRRHLKLCTESLVITASLVPAGGRRILGREYALIQNAGRSSLSAHTRADFEHLEEIQKGLQEALRSLPVPSLLPSLDPQRLS